MSVPVFKTVLSKRLPQPNEFGETPLPFAPAVRLQNGVEQVPQQYLQVQRTLANLENILAQITIPKGYLLFAGKESELLYIVVGVVGAENYPPSVQHSKHAKIVYGRRWLIEASTPTSEVVQTAMLAIKKAREHELREQFVVRSNNTSGRQGGSKRATPFNCHQDLPLMAASPHAFDAPDDTPLDPKSLRQLLGSMSVDGDALRLIEITPLGANHIVSFEVAESSQHSQFSDLQARPLHAVCDQLTADHVLHRILKSCLTESDRWVEEQVAFKGFKRFSETVSPTAVAEFSVKTRRVEVSDKRFNNAFSDMSYAVDSAKAPLINAGELGRRQRAQLANYRSLQGYLPKQ